METNIAVLLEKCLEEFEIFSSPANLARYSNEVSPDRWLDELGRLRVWTYNMCDDDEAQHLSLRYELRDSSHLLRAIVKILNRLLGLLQDLDSLTREDEDSESSLAITHPHDENEDITDVQYLYQSLRRSLGSLFQVSMEISNPASHDLLLGVTMGEQPDKGELQNYIRMSFPGADPILYDRITVLMARQASIMKYREQSQERRVSNNPDPASYPFSTGVTLSDELSKLASDEIFRFNTRQGLAFPIPKAPEDLSVSNAFERSKCQYCGFAIREIESLNDKASWIHHLFRDLMPYFCPFPACQSPLVLYGSADEWYSHVERSHSSSVDPYSISTDVCSLCQEVIKPPFTFKAHVQAHLEQIGFCVLAHHDPGYLAQVTSHNSDYNSYKMLHRFKVKPSNEILGEGPTHKRTPEQEFHQLSEVDDESKPNRDDESNFIFEKMAYWQQGDNMDFDGLFSYINSSARDTESMADTPHETEYYGESRMSLNKEESSALNYDDEDSSSDSRTIFGPLENTNQRVPSSNAIWTKLDRRLVGVEALDRFGESFEVKSTCVVVPRFLSKDEILRYAVVTMNHRDRRLNSFPFYGIIHDELLNEAFKAGQGEAKSLYTILAATPGFQSYYDYWASNLVGYSPNEVR